MKIEKTDNSTSDELLVVGDESHSNYHDSPSNSNRREPYRVNSSAKEIVDRSQNAEHDEQEN